MAAAAVADRIADDLLLTLRAVREALELPYTSISAEGDELASSGTAVTDLVRLQLMLGDDTIGEMAVGLRTAQLHLSAEDQQVLRIVGALLTQTLRTRSHSTSPTPERRRSRRSRTSVDGSSVTSTTGWTRPCRASRTPPPRREI